MAYLTKENTTNKRNAIKKMFPSKDGWKWSVTNADLMCLCVALIQYPKEYDFGSMMTIKNYNIDDSGLGNKEIEVLKKVKDLMFEGHTDDTDVQTDYFECSWYNRLSIGKWDKPASVSK